MNIFLNWNLWRDFKAELYLFNYATKAGFKNTRGVGTPKLTEKVDLASLKSIIDALDIDK